MKTLDRPKETVFCAVIAFPGSTFAELQDHLSLEHEGVILRHLKKLEQEGRVRTARSRFCRKLGTHQAEWYSNVG